MKNLNRGRYALSRCVAAAMLAGCGGSQPSIGAPGAIPQSPSTAIHENRSRSWMDTGASRWDLLYISNVAGPTVNVYRYWKHKLVGVLTGFTQPYGECVDAANNVYVTDFGAEKVFEFAHGGTHPIRAIDDSPYKPVGCAVDSSSGDLAIADAKELPTAPGSLAIYRHAKGKPRIYTGPLQGYASCAYDNSGDLLATDGADSSTYRGSGFAWLAKGSHALSPIAMHGGSTIAGNFNDVHGITWDGKYWVINGFQINRISQVSVIRRRGHLAGATYISGPESQMGPLAIYNNHPGAQGTQVVGTVGYDYPEVFYWTYPSGGKPIAEITAGLSIPFGVAISLKSTNN